MLSSLRIASFAALLHTFQCLLRVQAQACNGTHSSCPATKGSTCCNCLSDEWANGKGDWHDGFCCGHCDICCSEAPKDNSLEFFDFFEADDDKVACGTFTPDHVFSDWNDKGPGSAYYRKGASHGSCQENGERFVRCWGGQMPDWCTTYTKQTCLEWCQGDTMCVGAAFVPEYGGGCWLRRKSEDHPILITAITEMQESGGSEIALVCDVDSKEQPRFHFCGLTYVDLSAEQLAIGTGVDKVGELSLEQLEALNETTLASIRDYVAVEARKVASHETGEFCKHKSSRESVENFTCGETIHVHCASRIGDAQKVDLLTAGERPAGQWATCGGDSDANATLPLVRRLSKRSGLEVHLRMPSAVAAGGKLGMKTTTTTTTATMGRMASGAMGSPTCSGLFLLGASTMTAMLFV